MIPDKMSSEREGGFTLVELLIAITLSGILIVAITTGFIATLRGTATAHDRLVASNGSHTLSTYFTSDVESSNPDLTTTDASATMGCASEPPASTNVLRLQWSERTTSTELRAFSVSYRILASDTDSVPGNDKWQLLRYSCSASQNSATAGMAAVLSGATLTDHVVIDELHDPTAPNKTEACIDTTCTPAQPSRVVMLKVFAAAVKGESAPFSYSFSATMRTPKPAPRVVSIKRNGSATVNATTTSVAWTVTFSESVTNVDTGDFTFLNTGDVTGGSVTSVVPLTDSAWTVNATPGSGQGTMALSVIDNDTGGTIVSAIDGDRLGGPGPDNGSYTGGGYTVDTVPPAVVVAQSTGQVDPAGTTPILFTATFSESVTGFDSTDVSYSGTAPAGASISVTGSGKDYVISFTSVPGTGARTIRPSIALGKANDAAGNGNAASTSAPAPNDEVTYNPTGPTPTIASVDLWNGGTPGKIEMGDKVIVTFSETMSVSSFCSDWTNNSQDYVIDGNNKVTVKVKDDSAAGGDDELLVTVGGGDCSFNFGSVDLGSAGYVTDDTDFKGSGTDQSTIQWSASTRTLTIRLGSPNETTGTVAASAPTYTADPDIRTSTNGTVNNSPLTLANEQQF